jgi:2-aminoadipate transaminase
MTLRIPLSTSARRTPPPSISHLMQTALENPEIVSLAAGFVDQQSLPVEIADRAASELLGDPIAGRRALQYGTTIGDQGLRARLVAELEREEGRPGGFYKEAIPRTIVTTGSAQLIYLICEALLDPGDIVLVESPTYFVFLGPLETLGARAIRVPIDEGGLRLDELEATLERLEAEGQLERVKLIYTIPEHANPTGISLAADRRGPLVELARRWSRKHRIFVLEDAAYRGLSFGAGEPPSLWSHDRENDTVILARTFSKTFSPGLKLGYGVLPEGLIDPILYLKGNHDFGTTNFNQRLLERILADGSYHRHVSRLNGLYRRKAETFLAALQESIGDLDSEIHWTHPEGGLFVWMTVPEGLDTGFDGPLFPRCVREGVIYVPGEFAFAAEPSPRPKNHLRLTFGVPTEDELVEGARRLGAALSACLVPVA